jgi:hypothetical protein
MAYVKIGTVEPHYPEVANPCVAESVHALSLFDLSGKTALVTGGNGGIGSGMARALAEGGAKIIIVQIPSEQSAFSEVLARETGVEVVVYDCDLAENQEIRALIPKILADGHKIDILCNVAGISGGFVPILDENDEHRELVCPSRTRTQTRAAENGLVGLANGTCVNRWHSYITMLRMSYLNWLAIIWPRGVKAGKSSTSPRYLLHDLKRAFRLMAP